MAQQLEDCYEQNCTDHNYPEHQQSRPQQAQNFFARNILPHGKAPQTGERDDNAGDVCSSFLTNF